MIFQNSSHYNLVTVDLIEINHVCVTNVTMPCRLKANEIAFSFSFSVIIIISIIFLAFEHVMEYYVICFFWFICFSYDKVDCMR